MKNRPKELPISVHFVTEKTLIINGIPFTLEEANEIRRYLNEHYRELRPSKNWNACSYEGHDDSCDCRGVGGDR